MEGQITLGYWGFRGRAQVARLLLAYTKASWQDKLYLREDDWTGPGKDKVSLPLPLPNLPYLIHDETMISQSRAIQNYIINLSDKQDLLGKDLKDQTLLDCLRSNIEDLLNRVLEIYLNPEQAQQKTQAAQKALEGRLQVIQDMLQNKQFIFGYLTIGDFLLAEISYYVEKIFPELYERFSCLKVIRDSLEGIQQVKDYYASDSAIKVPFLPPQWKAF